jgi:2-polyprenyl-3-methyl-5-hydroxy-6-metoxy-1,4-benzoquinol methylase
MVMHTSNPSSVAAQGYGWHSAEPAYSQPYVWPGIRRALASLGSRRVLDIGCGNGALCGALAAQGCEVVGLEADAGGVEIARRAHPSVRFHHGGVEGDPQALLMQESRFDTVVSTEVIEHLYAPHLLPSFAAGVLAEGGHLVLTTPYHGYAKNLALSLFDKWDHHHTALWTGGHIKFWSRRTLTQLLARNGFTVVAFAGLGRLPLLWRSMLVVARKGTGARA